MKTIKDKKAFDAVKSFRAIKRSISKDIWGLSYGEMMAYLEHSKAGTEA
jgi:hypothetical protein